ncbi:MAG TPA: LamG domain-containing protein [Candidatus Binatia bacterium]|jgi:hypothetical protein|nr:LamG domain-containing protein [Candidatus Binatia bacterium]
MKLLRKPLTPTIRFLTCAAGLALIGLPAARAAYPDVILGDNPSAYYRLEETAGTTAADSSVNMVNATYVPNSLANDPQLGLPGIDTNSILFNGGGFSSDVGYVDIPASALITPPGDFGTNGGPFSAELWVQPTAQPATYSVPIEMAQYPNGWNIYVSGADANGGISYFYLNMPNGVLFQGEPDFPITFLRWYHLAVTFDGTNAFFYINGVSHGPYHVPNYKPAIGSDAHVGKGSGVGWTAFIGGIDEVAFYTNVLTFTQVTNHYRIGTNSFRAVPTPPAILADPATTTNYSGLPVSFAVSASGTLPLHYKWLKNGTHVGPDSTPYTFNCQYPADNGATIQVVVTNNYGSATSAVATLTVLTNLNIVGPPDSITRNVGSYAAFRVLANGAVPITYQWSASTDGGTTFTPISGATNRMFWLTNVQMVENGYVYSVQASGPFESASASATLTVQARATNIPLTKYGQVVASDGPVAYWRLDEPDGTGPAIDAVGSFNGSFDGTLSGGVFGFQAPTGIPHETDPGLFMTNGAQVTIPYAPELNPDGAWSAEGWFQPNSQDDYRIVLSSEYNKYPNPYNGWYIYQQPNMTLAFVPQPGNGFIVAGPDDPAHGNVLFPGNWYHLVVADDTTTFYVYINGELRSSFPVSGIPFIPNGGGINPDGTPGVTAGLGATVLGRRTDGAFGGFSGTIDDVAFYNKALTAQQVQAHHLATVRLTIVKSGNSVILSWPFGTLQSAPAVAGTYADIVSATSPYTNGITALPKYYRVKAYSTP